jgi:hypothetical protein
MNSQTMMMTVFGYVVCAILAGFAGTILWMIWTDKIDLSHLLCEANGSASMARFQLLIFTFVIAFSLFLLVEENGFFPWISDGVLTLLGISASTYAVGKGISYSRDEGVTTPEERQAKREASTVKTVAHSVADTATAHAVSDVANQPR